MIKVFILNTCFIRQDKISMAHGLESRVPYVDTKLFEVVNSISYNQRYRKNITKNTLKQISKNFFLKILYIERKMVLTYQFPNWLKDRNGFGKDLLITLNSLIVK